MRHCHQMPPDRFCALLQYIAMPVKHCICNKIRVFDELCRKQARFSADHSKTIAESNPAIPENLNDREQDNWEPLLAIAEAAGGHWPETARRAAVELSQKLGRKIDVCDPYAGVGPAVIPLAKLNESVDRIFASDLNPSAALLLAKNLPNIYAECKDALTLHEELPQCCDLLLVNLPHNTLEHLEHVTPLLKSGHLVCIRGWAIVSKDDMGQVEKQIRNSLKNCKIRNISIESSKSYSPKHNYISINVELVR